MVAGLTSLGEDLQKMYVRRPLGRCFGPFAQGPASPTLRASPNRQNHKGP